MHNTLNKAGHSITTDMNTYMNCEIHNEQGGWMVRDLRLIAATLCQADTA